VVFGYAKQLMGARRGELRQAAGGLGLLVDPEPATRLAVRPLLAERGIDLVHARTGIAALELIWRMPDSFRVVIVSYSLPGLSGSAVLETLRHFRPALPLVCLSGGEETRVPAPAGTCLSKPVNNVELAAQLDGALGGSVSLPPLVDLAPETIARARARYALSGNLVEAALEMEREISGQEE
jgi:DNA-binding response OmpR family regulator